jgi:hypothetical protein
MMMKSDNKLTSFFKKADIILLAVFLLMGAGSLLAAKLQPSSGSTVVISVNGEEYGRYPLDVDREIDVDTVYGHNTVVISASTVCVSDSDCPNLDCERFGRISRPSQTIMCLPHRMLIRITGDTDIDAVIY